MITHFSEEIERLADAVSSIQGDIKELFKITRINQDLKPDIKTQIFSELDTLKERVSNLESGIKETVSFIKVSNLESGIKETVSFIKLELQALGEKGLDLEARYKELKLLTQSHSSLLDCLSKMKDSQESAAPASPDSKANHMKTISQKRRNIKNSSVMKVPLPLSGRYLQKIITALVASEEREYSDFLIEVENDEMIFTRV